MVGAGLDVRPVRQPRGQPDNGAEQGADNSHREPVGPDDETDVVVRGAHGAEHAQRAQPALRQHGEAPDGHQGDEEHADRGQSEHDGLGVERVAGRRRGTTFDGRTDGGGLYPRRVEQHGHLGRGRDLARHHQGELIQQALRVLDDAGDAPGLSALVPDVANLEVERGGDAIGHGHLARTGRVVPADQRKHRPAERTVRVLGPQVVRADRAGDGDGLVLDDVHAAEALPQRGNLAVQPRSGRAEGGDVLGGAEPGVGRGRRVGRHRRADDGGTHRDHDEGQHQQLLAPLTAEQPPSPADHRPAGGNAPVTGSRPRRALAQRGGHWIWPGVRSDSGPTGGEVWSTACPSRRNTTRSAQEASCASWVTTTAATPRLHAL